MRAKSKGGWENWENVFEDMKKKYFECGSCSRDEKLDTKQLFCYVSCTWTIVHTPTWEKCWNILMRKSSDMDLCMVYLLHAFVLVSRSRFLMDRSRALRLYRVAPTENPRNHSIYDVFQESTVFISIMHQKYIRNMRHWTRICNK